MAAVIRVRIRQCAQKYVQTLLQPSKSESKHKAYFRNSSFLFVVGQEIRMPSLSPTMSEGTIVKWFKNEGDAIVPGDVLCDIQTDKAVVSFETEEEGVLAKILVPENTKDIKVGTLIGLMVGEGEDWKSVEMPTASATTTAVTPPNATGGGGGGASGGDSGVKPAGKPTFPTSILKSFGPAVRQLMIKYDLKSDQITPTGHRGKILKEDVLKFIAANKLAEKPLKEVPPPTKGAAAATATKPAKVPEKRPTKVIKAKGAGFDDIDISNMRKVIAKRLTESKTNIPHSFTSAQCSLNKILEMRKNLKNDGVAVSINDFVIKAVANALQQCPEVNALYVGDKVVLVPEIDISVAVATDAGLITPIIKDAVSKGLVDISSTVKELALKAREGKLKPQEFQGGSFTVSNLGMYGVKQFSAIINPPQCAILSVGGGQDCLDQDGGGDTRMTMTLSFDSRAIDDGLASEFLQVVRDMLENPALMLLGGHQALRAKLGL